MKSKKEDNLQCFTPNMRNSIERNPDGGKTLLDKGICPG